MSNEVSPVILALAAYKRGNLISDSQRRLLLQFGFLEVGNNGRAHITIGGEEALRDNGLGPKPQNGPSTLESVLQEVRSGTSSFAPASNSEEDMRDFQPIAKILVYAQQEGLLEKCIPHKESGTGSDWYDLVVVRGGLSYKGEKLLSEPPAAAADQKLSDIIQLKPSVYGIGIDLKALWLRWKNRKGQGG